MPGNSQKHIDELAMRDKLINESKAERPVESAEAEAKTEVEAQPEVEEHPAEAAEAE